MDKRKNASDVRTRPALHAFHPYSVLEPGWMCKNGPSPQEHIMKWYHSSIVENVSFLELESQQKSLFKFLGPFVENQSRHGDVHSLGLSHRFVFFQSSNEKKKRDSEKRIPAASVMVYPLQWWFITNNMGMWKLNVKPPTADRIRAWLEAGCTCIIFHNLEVQDWLPILQM